MDIWDYFFRFQYEVRRPCGVDPEYERFSVNPGSDRAGVAEVIVSLASEAHMRFYEKVEIVDGRWARRARYSYVLVVAGHHLHSWELDRAHSEMPIHEHVGRERERLPSAEMSITQTLAAAWDLLSRKEG